MSQWEFSVLEKANSVLNLNYFVLCLESLSCSSGFYKNSCGFKNITSHKHQRFAAYCGILH